MQRSVEGVSLASPSSPHSPFLDTILPHERKMGKAGWPMQISPLVTPVPAFAAREQPVEYETETED